VTKLSKPAFIGRDILLKQKQDGIKRKLVGLELVEPGIARSEYPLLRNGNRIGRVTSGTKSPTLGKSIALGYVTVEESHPGTIFDVEIRGRAIKTKVVSLPFYRR
jgi:aminomethyltransferase